MYEYPKYKYLELEKIQDGILIIRFNRPDRLNAIDLGEGGMHEEIEDVFQRVNFDRETRAVIITGKGKAFSAGGDIKYFKEVIEKSGWRELREIRRLIRMGKRIVENLLDIEVPTIAAINGPAMGLGATIALFCDITIMSKSATIGDPHVSVGLVAGDGGAVIWPLLVGVNRAKYYLMTGEQLTAEEAERIGLVNMVVPDDKLMEVSINIARKLANGASLAISWTKFSINKIIKHYLELILDLSLSLESHTFNSKDHSEGVNAFLQKRKPNYRGE
ncbi:MAG: enoyl-CoA hydratase-related protein [Sulfolobaceae archaeon]